MLFLFLFILLIYLLCLSSYVSVGLSESKGFTFGSLKAFSFSLSLNNWSFQGNTYSTQKSQAAPFPPLSPVKAKLMCTRDLQLMASDSN